MRISGSSVQRLSLLVHVDDHLSGTTTSDFTALNQLFLNNPLVIYWRFEVTYHFDSDSSHSALNFVINQPPRNGSCSISPQNGTTQTVFTIACPNWFDEDQIGDYSVYSRAPTPHSKGNIVSSGYTANETDQMLIAFSPVPTFDVRLPAGDSNTSYLQLVIQIRDRLDCVTRVNMTLVTVVQDTTPITVLGNSSLLQLLSSGNQNSIGQVISSISQELNRMNTDSVQDAATSNSQRRASIP